MTKKTKKDENLAPVVIFGHTYKVRAEEDGDYIEELARYVDTKMRTISESTGTEDALKIAILAALNIADEFFKLGEERRTSDSELVSSVDAMLKNLTESLKAPTETSPASSS